MQARTLQSPFSGLGRVVVAVLAGYAVNAALVAITEQIFLLAFSGNRYRVADLLTQCAIEVLAGYVCCALTGSSRRWYAASVLIGLGFLVGVISLVTSWNSAPHWYAISLLCVWAPFLCLGAFLQLCSKRARE